MHVSVDRDSANRGTPTPNSAASQAVAIDTNSTSPPAKNVAAAFEAATFKYKRRHPRVLVETIAVQEMADEYALQWCDHLFADK